MSVYRTGAHWGVTIVREGTGQPDDTGRRPGDELVAVVVNGDKALAERICALLNADTTGPVHTRTGGAMTDPITLRFGGWDSSSASLPTSDLASRAALWALGRNRPDLAAPLAQLAAALSSTDLVQRVADLEREAEREWENRMGEDI